MTREYETDRSWWGRPRMNATRSSGIRSPWTVAGCSSPHFLPAVELRPGVGTFLHSESCSIGISGSIPMTLSWARVQAAVNDLVEVCVNDPLATAVSGRPSKPRRHRRWDGWGWEKDEEVQERRHCVECSFLLERIPHFSNSLGSIRHFRLRLIRSRPVPGSKSFGIRM